MTSIIITPRNKKELSALKHFIKALDLPYNESKEDISTNTITKEQFVEELLRDKLDARVKISEKKIEINFSNINDLNRILEILNIKE